MIFDKLQREHLIKYCGILSADIGKLEDGYDAANIKYKEDTKDIYKDGKYQGDFGMGLTFVMMTYNKETWLIYFDLSPSNKSGVEE